MNTSFFDTQEKTTHIMIKSVNLCVYAYPRRTRMNTRSMPYYFVKRT